MATIVIDTDNSLNLKQFITSLYMFKGVRKVSLEDGLNYPKLDKSISEANSGRTVHCKNVSDLIHNLNS
jgi:hypothetical protein